MQRRFEAAFHHWEERLHPRDRHALDRFRLRDMEENPVGFADVAFLDPGHPDAGVGQRYDQPFVPYLVTFSSELQGENNWEGALLVHRGNYMLENYDLEAAGRAAKEAMQGEERRRGGGAWDA